MQKGQETHSCWGDMSQLTVLVTDAGRCAKHLCAISCVSDPSGEVPLPHGKLSNRH